MSVVLSGGCGQCYVFPGFPPLIQGMESKTHTALQMKQENFLWFKTIVQMAHKETLSRLIAASWVRVLKHKKLILSVSCYVVQKKEEWLRGGGVGVGPFHIDKLARTFTFSILYVLSPSASDFNHSFKMLSCHKRLRLATLTPKQFKMNWLFCSSYPFDTWVETLL